MFLGLNGLTHWGRVTHICISKIIIIGSDNGLSSGRRQAIIWTNDGILLIGPLRTNFSEIWIQINNTFSFTKMHLKMSSGKCRPYCLGLNVLRKYLFTSIWVTTGGGITKPISSISSFSNFSQHSENTLVIEYHVYIWQVSLQLSCSGTCQI